MHVLQILADQMEHVVVQEVSLVDYWILIAVHVHLVIMGQTVSLLITLQINVSRLLV